LGTVSIGLLQNEAEQSVNIHLSVRNNLWAHYGNKSIKSKLYEVEKNHLNLFAQEVKDPARLSVMNVLMANLDREIARYKKEQSDIQSEAVKSDTRFELAKRKHFFFSIAFYIALFSLLSFVGAHTLKVETSLWSKLVYTISFAKALLISLYAFWFV